MVTPEQLQQGIEVARNVIGGGTGAFIVAAALKAIPFVPIEAGQTVRIRALVGVLAAANTVLTQYADGAIVPQSVQEALLAVLVFVGTFFTAHGMHKASKAMNQ